MIEIRFRLRHDCPWTELTQSYPDVVFSHWCNWEKDVLEILYKDLRSFQPVQQDLQHLMGRLRVKITRKFFSSQNVQLIVQNCGCEKLKLTISTLLAKHNCIEFQPCIYREGWEWYRIFAFTDKDIRALFNELSKVGKAEVVMRATREGSTLRENLMVSVSNLFGELTQKQADALVAALHHDYYGVPKKRTTDQIAAVLRMPRTTYEEHLRKAESKVLLAIAPYLELTKKS